MPDRSAGVERTLVVGRLDSHQIHGDPEPLVTGVLNFCDLPELCFEEGAEGVDLCLGGEAALRNDRE